MLSDIIAVVCGVAILLLALAATLGIGEAGKDGWKDEDYQGNHPKA